MAPRHLLLLAPLLFVACQSGLTPYQDALDDTDLVIGDTAPGGPLDTDDTDPLANQAPVADAGADLEGLVGDIIQLDGSGSFDPDGDALDYSWELAERPTGSGTNMINADQPNPRFYADRGGVFRAVLTVDDGELSSVDDVEIVVEAPNDPPYADAGFDQTVGVGDVVQLNGNQSYDPEGEPLTYQWSMTARPSGSGAYLIDATSALPRFTADTDGGYTVQLIVNDGVFDSPADTVQITAQAQDSGDCLSCSAQVRMELERRLTLGDAASGPGLVLLPLLMLLWQRKRRED